MCSRMRTGSRADTLGSEDVSAPTNLILLQGTVTSTATCIQLHKRAERVAAALMEKGRLDAGDHVALVYPPGKCTLKTLSRPLETELSPLFLL